MDPELIWRNLIDLYNKQEAEKNGYVLVFKGLTPAKKEEPSDE